MLFIYIKFNFVVSIFEELKVKEGVMDFSDLICNTLLLFRTRKNILKNYQNQFKHVLVDEFQDTKIGRAHV